MRGSHLLPSQLPGEHTGHKAASRHSEPIWNAHIPPIALIAGTHFTYPRRDGRLSQPEEYSTAGPSHLSHYGAMPVYYFQVRRQIMWCTALLDIRQCSTCSTLIYQPFK